MPNRDVPTKPFDSEHSDPKLASQSDCQGISEPNDITLQNPDSLALKAPNAYTFWKLVLPTFIIRSTKTRHTAVTPHQVYYHFKHQLVPLGFNKAFSWRKASRDRTTSRILKVNNITLDETFKPLDSIHKL
jgi:hypothetical protein